MFWVMIAWILQIFVAYTAVKKYLEGKFLDD